MSNSDISHSEPTESEITESKITESQATDSETAESGVRGYCVTDFRARDREFQLGVSEAESQTTESKLQSHRLLNQRLPTQGLPNERLPTQRLLTQKLLSQRVLCHVREWCSAMAALARQPYTGGLVALPAGDGGVSSCAWMSIAKPAATISWLLAMASYFYTLGSVSMGCLQLHLAGHSRAGGHHQMAFGCYQA